MSEVDDTVDNPEQNLLPTDNSTTIDMTAQLEAVTQRMQQIQESNQQQFDALTNAIMQSQQSPQQEIDYYSDPDKYIENKLKEKTAALEKKLEEREQSNRRANAVMADLARQFPEINNPNSNIYKQADKEIKSLPDSLKNTAEGIKLAVLQAAAATGTVAIDKRSPQESEISIPSSKKKPQQQHKDKGQTSEITKLWSKYMGRDVDSEEYKKGIEAATNRSYKGYK